MVSAKKDATKELVLRCSLDGNGERLQLSELAKTRERQIERERRTLVIHNTGGMDTLLYFVKAWKHI